MRALFFTPPKPEELAAVGATPEDYFSPDSGIDGIYFDAHAQAWCFELWAENRPAFDLYQQISTQWRTGPGGPVGLDYLVVFHELDRRDLSREQYDDFLWAIRVIEHAAITELHKRD